MTARLFVAVLICAVRPLFAEKPPTDTLIPWLLEHRGDLRDIPFPDVVRAATGHRVIPVDPKSDGAWLQSLGGAIDAAISRLNDPRNKIHTVGRINEASRFVEDALRREISKIRGWKCTVPRTAAGAEQRAGYPDLRVETASGRVFFLDPKLFAPDAESSALRTFYFEPTVTTGKIHEDASHLLVGIGHNGLSGRDSRLVRWEIVDLSRLNVRLKAEFQASNRDLYRPDLVVAKSPR